MRRLEKQLKASSAQLERQDSKVRIPLHLCMHLCTSAPLHLCASAPCTLVLHFFTPHHLVASPHLYTCPHLPTFTFPHFPTAPRLHRPTAAPCLQVQALSRRLEALAHASTESHPSDCAYWVERGKRLDFVGARAVRPAIDRAWAKAANAAVPAAAARSARPAVPVLPPVDAASTDVAVPTKVSVDSAAVAAAKVRARARAAPPPAPAARSRSKPQGGRPRGEPTVPSSVPPVALSGDV